MARKEKEWASSSHTAGMSGNWGLELTGDVALTWANAHMCRRPTNLSLLLVWLSSAQCPKVGRACGLGIRRR